MRFHCSRCEWSPTTDPTDPGPQTQLLEHAVEAGHPLCRCCSRSLSDHDIAVCLACVADTRRRLAEVVSTYAMLPSVFGRLGSSSDWRRNGPRDAETGIPGGDALVMFSPGSNGSAQMVGGHLSDGTPWLVLAEHEADELVGDAQSVAFELWSWERDWREWRGEAERSGPVTVAGVVDYLSIRLGWAADTHLAFPDFTHDVRVLLSRLETALAMGERSDVGVACQSCGADLQRHYAEPKPCEHDRPTLVPQWSDHGRTVWLGDCQETPEELDARLAAWERKHAHCQQGGLEESWVCPSCPRVYTPEEYRLAVAAEMYVKRNEAHYWVPVATAARLADRAHMTIKDWADSDVVEVFAVCDIRTRRLKVLLSSVLAVARLKAPHRRRVA